MKELAAYQSLPVTNARWQRCHIDADKRMQALNVPNDMYPITLRPSRALSVLAGYLLSGHTLLVD